MFHALYDAQGPDIYTVQLELELEGVLDCAALQAAWQAVAARHSSLRSGFRHEQLSRPVQVVLARIEMPWRLIDLSDCATAEQQRRVAELLDADRLERFDLAAPPLMRFALIRLGAERHRLLISNHHLLMDGWSAPILVRELLQAYAQGGSGASLPRVTPYRDYLAHIARQDRAAGLAAWRDSLAGLEEGTRLAGLLRRTGAAAGGAAAGQPLVPEHIELPLGEVLSAALHRTAREQALTLNTLLQAAWGILLGRLSGRDDVVFGVTVAGRPAELAGVEHMVGLFINTLPLRMRLPPQLSLSELLRQTQERQSRLIAHQHIGLAEIQQAAGVGDLFDTLMVFENYPVDREGLAAQANGLRLGRVEGHDATHYPLALIVRPGEQLRLRLDYRPDLFDAATAAGLGERLVRLLRAVVVDSGRALGRLEILGEAERDTILRGWNDTAHAPARGLTRSGAAAGDAAAAAALTTAMTPAAMTLPSLFAAQARRTPDAVAVLFEDRALSYAALEAHANRLAHHLQSLGVGPDVLVGVLAERSPEMVVGLLGILKAGGAYLPLDPNYPRERLADGGGCGLLVLVTQEGLRGACRSRRRPRHRAARCRGAAIARQPERRAASRSRSAPPRLRDLHLGLDRQAQGRGGEHTAR